MIVASEALYTTVDISKLMVHSRVVQGSDMKMLFFVLF